MNNLRFICVSKYLRASAVLAIGFFFLIMPTSLVLSAQPSSAVDKHDPNAAVTVTDNGRTWTLDNGIVKATIRKDSGSMASLVYRGVETMGGNGGYWEQTPQDAQQLSNTITIDPATMVFATAWLSASTARVSALSAMVPLPITDA